MWNIIYKHANDSVLPFWKSSLLLSAIICKKGWNTEQAKGKILRVSDEYSEVQF